jgi:hypothetical protein
MLMADTMAIAFTILGLLMAFPGLWLLCRGLWPNTVRASCRRCEKGLIRPFLVGAVISALLVIPAIAVARLGGLGAILAVAIICSLLIVANIGVAGLATCIGERLTSPSDYTRPWRATLRGGVALELSYLLPILGWFLILPASLIIGCGAATLSLIGLIRSPEMVNDVIPPQDAVTESEVEASGVRA